MSCTGGGGFVHACSGRAVGTYGPAQAYTVTRPQGYTKRDNRRRIRMFGGKVSVTLETLFYFYLAALALGVAYQRGWFGGWVGGWVV